MHLLGDSGEKLLKLRGIEYKKGEPVYAWVSKDYEPCDDCKSKYIGIVVMDDAGTAHRGVYQTTIEDFESWPDIHPNDKYWALKTGKVFIKESYAEKLGLLDVKNKASERKE